MKIFPLDYFELVKGQSSFQAQLNEPLWLG